MKPREFIEWYHQKFISNYREGYWTTKKDDHECLITLISQYNCQTVLEIGTSKGDTALLMYLYPLVKRLKCIDIHEGMGVSFDNNPGGNVKNHALMEKSEYGTMFKNTFVHLQFADTMTYPRGCEQHDLVFIDACHDYEHVKNDTELAISMEPKVICWHDFQNGNPGVDQFIAECINNGSKIHKWVSGCCVYAMPQDIIIKKGEPTNGSHA